MVRIARRAEPGQSAPGRASASKAQVLDGNAAIAGHGVAILSPPMFLDAIDAGLLVPPFPHVATYRNSLLADVYPEYKRHLAKMRALREWLIDAVKHAAGADPYRVLAQQ
jgi:LysR family glycine cleavage system transcriptional activator